MHVALFVLTLGIMHNPGELPKDPFQREATLYLSGKLGKIDPELAEVYQRGLDQGVTASHLVWFTCFYGTEPSGKHDRRGKRCDRKTAAANKVSEGCWIWSKVTGLRKIRDSGASSNDYAALHPPRSHGKLLRRAAEFWVDIWYPTSAACRWGHSAVMQMAVIR